MGTQATGKKHALLSASSSHRWLECTPSAVAESTYPETTSAYAEEGSLAHAICARKLKRALGLPHREEDIEIEELRDYYSEEMEGHTDRFVDHVLARYEEARRECHGARLLIETRLDFSFFVPEGFGTGDALIVTDGRIEVIDFKYGKGVRVDAVENPQMKLYALGALDEFDYRYTIDEVRMTIVQPRLGHLSEWSQSVETLLAWANNELHPLARLAFIGKGARHAGEWCRFCRAKPDCAMHRAYGLTQDARLDFHGMDL